MPAATITGRVDRIPQPSLQRASVTAAIGEALPQPAASSHAGAARISSCGLQLIFINTLHLPNYMALCGQDMPMLGATALAIIGGINISSAA